MFNARKLEDAVTFSSFRFFYYTTYKKSSILTYMSFASTNIALENFFTTRWVESYNTPIAYGNVDYDSEGVDEWVRFSVHWEDGVQASLGNDCRLHRFYGSIIVQIYAPVNLGMKRVLQLTDEVIDILTSQQISGAVLGTASTRMIGQTNNWEQINVRCPFWLDQQLSDTRGI